MEIPLDGLKIRVYYIDRRDLEDLAFCAYLSRKNPLWVRGLVICACCDFLDARTIAREFLRNNVILMEQVCYCFKRDYDRVIKVKDGDVVIDVPLIRAYGVFRALGEYLLRKISSGELEA